MTIWGARAGRWMAAATAMACAALATTAAKAEWREARGRHFILYGNMPEDTLRTMATRLEQFDGAMRQLHSLAQQEGEESNPVTVYVLPDESAVRRLYGKGGDNIAGFYEPRVSGSVAFTPMRGQGDGLNALKPQIVLFHEYAHHFLLGNSRIAYPAWYSEGYAEFVSTARFDREGVMIGVAAQHRAYGLIDSSKLPIETLFDSTRRKLDSRELDQVYGRGWLLTHYLQFDPAQSPRLSQYLKLLNQGVPSIAAGDQAFGSLKTLDRQLDGYLRRSTLPARLVRFERLPKAEVAVRTMSPGEQAMMPLRMQSDRGVNRTTGQQVYDRAARIAAAYPGEAVVQGWFAEMAYDVGQDAAAEAAADRALAIDPKSQQGLLYKGLLHLRRAYTEHSRDAARWREARSWIIRANRVDPNAAEPLATFYRSFLMAGEKPSDSAVAGLARAFELVPQDRGLRFLLAGQQITADQVDDAKRTLRPLAFDPHSPADNPAATLLALLEAGKTQEVKVALATMTERRSQED